jgi:fructokinase
MMRKRFTVVGLGEVLWDVFPDGPRFGGAPANFACHAAMLGADAFMVSQVGTDELGDRAIVELSEHGVHTDAMGRTADSPTGTVQVALDAAGKPTFTIADNVAWDAIPWSFALASLAGRADAVCFGTLAQRHEASRQTIRQFLNGTGPECLRIFDVNLRPPFFDAEIVRVSLPLANVLKLNDEELPIIAAMLNVTGNEIELLTEIRSRYLLRLVALTKGARGAMLLSDAGTWEGAAPPVQVRDTVGAGDAFTAAMTMGLLRGDDLETIGRHACEVAAFVCTQAGAVPQLPDSLRR